MTLQETNVQMLDGLRNMGVEVPSNEILADFKLKHKKVFALLFPSNEVALIRRWTRKEYKEHATSQQSIGERDPSLQDGFDEEETIVMACLLFPTYTKKELAEEVGAGFVKTVYETIMGVSGFKLVDTPAEI